MLTLIHISASNAISCIATRKLLFSLWVLWVNIHFSVTLSMCIPSIVVEFTDNEVPSYYSYAIRLELLFCFSYIYMFDCSE